ncbi:MULTISPECIES: DUF3105 domain-containing protein [Dactylosporangium]|uniref:DUF3105 domain-containing protein n=2 Tax=Dactylosporangium TaxID=35753 RepID=A0A9W6KEY2_9ACTN|nr:MULTISPECIES: DUF3105 domain-containing protein [Dactylosporangium]UAB97889.1 DUF3105 domain-containing protein [Dactylosporangium vinaceum]UWZ46136.1 DUF3105 domain-containing protein [Dactylosporangium matsuzakiense]GLL00278.1 hypothetical protein GCM10017581_020180 [Dactylosporangium matsuzakiense]
MSTQHSGGNRKPSTKAVSGAKPKQGGDEDPVEDADLLEDSSVEDVDSSVEDDDAAEAPVRTAKPKANPRKSAPARKTTTAGKRPATATRPAVKKIAPVKVKQGVSWGPIALFATVGVLALGIVGFAGYQVYENGLGWHDRADQISGIQDYYKIDKAMVGQREHVWGPQTYKVNPPVAGNHNANWQRCLGDVYTAPIASEHALHSMEHGAVWITYNPSLPADQVEKLAKRVRGNDYMLMSPFEKLDKPISLQAWGFQLKVDNADDSRIDEFIKALRQNASLEAGTPCSSGDIITETGTTPRDLGKDGSATEMGGGN